MRDWKDIFMDEDTPENPRLDLPTDNEKAGEDNGMGSEASGALSEDDDPSGMKTVPFGEDEITGEKSTDYADVFSFLDEDEEASEKKEEDDGDKEEDGDIEEDEEKKDRRKSRKKRRNSFSIFDEDAPGNPSLDLPSENEREGEDNGQGSEAAGALSEDDDPSGMKTVPFGEDEITGEKSTNYADFWFDEDEEEKGEDEESDDDGDEDDEEDNSEKKDRRGRRKRARRNSFWFDEDEEEKSEDDEESDEEDDGEDEPEEKKDRRKSRKKRRNSFWFDEDEEESEDNDDSEDDSEDDSDDDEEEEKKDRRKSRKKRRNSFWDEDDEEGSDDDGQSEKEPVGKPDGKEGKDDDDDEDEEATQDWGSFFDEGFEEPENLPGNPKPNVPGKMNGEEVCPNGCADLPEKALTEPVLVPVETQNGELGVLQNRRHVSDRYFFN